MYVDNQRINFVKIHFYFICWLRYMSKVVCVKISNVETSTKNRCSHCSELWFAQYKTLRYSVHTTTRYREQICTLRYTMHNTTRYREQICTLRYTMHTTTRCREQICTLRYTMHTTTRYSEQICTQLKDLQLPLKLFFNWNIRLHKMLDFSLGRCHNQRVPRIVLFLQRISEILIRQTGILSLEETRRMHRERNSGDFEYSDSNAGTSY